MRKSVFGTIWLLAAAFLLLASLPSAMAAKSSDTPAVRRVVLHYATIQQRKYLYLREVAAYYKYTYAANVKAQTARLTNAWSQSIVFTANEPLFTLSRITCSLSYPIVLRRGEFLIEYTDFKAFLDPIVRTGTIPRRAIHTIVLDPGHGGNDHGTELGGVMEKNLNLQMVRRIGAMLARRGYLVYFTRKSDTAVSLAERSNLGARLKCDLFLSLHVNSAPQTDIHGIEVFIANPAGTPSFGTTTLGKDSPGVKFNSTNALWAFLTQKALLKATLAADRGIKRKQFYVINNTPAPSLLVEIGFLTNPAEAKKIQDGTYQDKLAGAICDAIDSLAKTLKPPAPAKTIRN